VYSGKDARAGQNCNAIILELPLAFLTDRPSDHRIVNTWGESWVLKASSKVETIPDDPFWIEHPHVLLDAFTLDDRLGIDWVHTNCGADHRAQDAEDGRVERPDTELFCNIFLDPRIDIGKGPRYSRPEMTRIWSPENRRGNPLQSTGLGHCRRAGWCRQCQSPS
jgi:hypothetical protein